MHNGHQTQGWQKTSSGGKGPVFGTGPYLVQLSEFEVRYRPRQPQHHRISERQALVTSGEAVFRERHRYDIQGDIGINTRRHVCGRYTDVPKMRVNAVARPRGRAECDRCTRRSIAHLGAGG